MYGFKWKNREFCLRRIFALVSCKGIELNKATRMALEKTEQDGSFSYCTNPDLISDSELIRLREHARTLIESKGKEREARQLTISGI